MMSIDIHFVTTILSVVKVISHNAFNMRESMLHRYTQKIKRD